MKKKKEKKWIAYLVTLKLLLRVGRAEFQFLHHKDLQITNVWCVQIFPYYIVSASNDDDGV